MAKKPRYIPQPGSLVEVSNRAVGSRFLLKPSLEARQRRRGAGCASVHVRFVDSGIHNCQSLGYSRSCIDDDRAWLTSSAREETIELSSFRRSGSRFILMSNLEAARVKTEGCLYQSSASSLSL